MQRPFAAAMSADVDPGGAVGEVIGAVLEQLGGVSPDLGIVFVAGEHVEHLADIVQAVAATVAPSTLVAASAVGVLGGSIEAETGPAVSLWAGRTGPVRSIRMEAFDRHTVMGVPDDLVAGETLLLVADPYSFPLDVVFEAVPDGVAVVGGAASAAAEPGGNRLWIDGVEHRNGAVGVVFPAGVVTPIVSQGCRPIGQPWVVTRSEGNLIHELAGQPAADRVQELIAGLSSEDRSAASRGLHIGVVADEQRENFDRGDFLIRGVMGIDKRTRALAIGDVVEVGQLVQFQVRDPASASVDLAELLRSSGDEGRLHGALVFTCNGRGTHLFPEPHHDAAAVAEVVDGGVAGMFCAGEFGPVAGRNALHGFTATIVGFRPIA